MTDSTDAYCNDAGKPGCLTVADERFTMRFDDIGQPPIHWCAACGPDAHAIDAMLTVALRDDEFAEEFRAAVDAAEPRAMQ